MNEMSSHRLAHNVTRLSHMDVSDIRHPKSVGSYNYHPPFVEPTHTFREMPQRIGGKRIAIAIDEEDRGPQFDILEFKRG